MATRAAGTTSGLGEGPDDGEDPARREAAAARWAASSCALDRAASLRVGPAAGGAGAASSDAPIPIAAATPSAPAQIQGRRRWGVAGFTVSMMPRIKGPAAPGPANR
ncbi:hypothetical protein GCM10027449_13340 [Sinomonas notoginsengisoli]